MFFSSRISTLARVQHAALACGVPILLAGGCAQGTSAKESNTGSGANASGSGGSIAGTGGSDGGAGGEGGGEGGGGETCAKPLTACGGACIDPLTDPKYCGASGTCLGPNAGKSCDPIGETCVAGACTSICAAGEVMCDGSCVSPLTDSAHCGASANCIGPNAGVVCKPEPNACLGSPEQSCIAGKCGSACASGGETFSFTGGVVTYVLPACVTALNVTAFGAQGGSSSAGSAGGLGATVSGALCVTPGSTLTIVVGEQAPSAPYPCGGGGGSFVATGTTPLFVAGGGGGGYSDWMPGGAATLLATLGQGIGGVSFNDGGGGGGFSMNGAGSANSGGIAFLNGAMAGVEFPMGNTNASRGGFGGGGGSSQSGSFNAGGGGGFDGGKAGNGNASTGGTSFITTTATNPLFAPAVSKGNGSVMLTW